MKLLTDSYIFRELNRTTKLKDNMVSFNHVTDVIKQEKLEEYFRSISRYKYALKNPMVDAYSSNKLLPAYNKNKLRWPNSFPAVLRNYNGKVVSIVNLSSLGSINKKEEFVIDVRKFYSLMEAGYIVYSLYENWNSFIVNQNILKLGSIIYSKMLTKVLDRLYAVNYKPSESDALRFICAKFFLRNLIQRKQTETLDSIAYTACINDTSKSSVIDACIGFPEEGFDDISTFISSLSIHFNSLRKLNISVFLETYIKLYNAAALTALDLPQYFCTTIANVVIGANINSNFVFEGLIGKDLDKFYNEMSRILK